MVGGLIVSYRLVGEVRGASSTNGGMASSCESSVMELCTGVSLGALRRLEGDEDLAPWVFAMVDLEKVAGGARAAWAQMGGGSSEGCSGLGPISHQREVQMTGLKMKFGIYNV